MDKIKLEINAHYIDVLEALEDKGYDEIRDREDVVSKDGKIYKIANVNKFNTWIYYIDLEESVE